MDNPTVSGNVNNQYTGKGLIRGTNTNGISTIPYIYAQPQSHNICNGGLSSDCEVETSFETQIQSNHNLKPLTMIVGDDMRNQTVLMSDTKRNSNPMFCVGVCTKGITVVSEECDDELEEVASLELGDERRNGDLLGRVDWEKEISSNTRGLFLLFVSIQGDHWSWKSIATLCNCENPNLQTLTLDMKYVNNYI